VTPEEKRKLIKYAAEGCEAEEDRIAAAVERPIHELLSQAPAPLLSPEWRAKLQEAAANLEQLRAEARATKDIQAAETAQVALGIRLQEVLEERLAQLTLPVPKTVISVHVRDSGGALRVSLKATRLAVECEDKFRLEPGDEKGAYKALDMFIQEILDESTRVAKAAEEA
jgi:hypothetical protein